VSWAVGPPPIYSAIPPIYSAIPEAGTQWHIANLPKAASKLASNSQMCPNGDSQLGSPLPLFARRHKNAMVENIQKIQIIW